MWCLLRKIQTKGKYESGEKKQTTVIRKKEKTVIAQRNCEYVFVSPPAREWGSRVTSLVPQKCKAVLM